MPRKDLFDLEHHGDEIILNTEGDQVKCDYKQQTGMGEFRHYKLTTPSQNSMFELLRVIMRGRK